MLYSLKRTSTPQLDHSGTTGLETTHLTIGETQPHDSGIIVVPFVPCSETNGVSRDRIDDVAYVFGLC